MRIDPRHRLGDPEPTEIETALAQHFCDIYAGFGTDTLVRDLARLIAKVRSQRSPAPLPELRKLAESVAKDWKPGEGEAVLRLAEGVLGLPAPEEDT